jgi:hypothetical protein
VRSQPLGNAGTVILVEEKVNCFSDSFLGKAFCGAQPLRQRKAALAPGRDANSGSSDERQSLEPEDEFRDAAKLRHRRTAASEVGLYSFTLFMQQRLSDIKSKQNEIARRAD